MYLLNFVFITQTQHGANLLKHLKHIHPEQHKIISDINNTLPGERGIFTESVCDKVLEECTNLIAIHGRPFSMINDIAFQNLLKMIPNNNMSINSRKIRDNVVSIASNHRYNLSKELQGKVLCLKIDVASLATRCFLGINCQYSEEGRII